MIDDAGDFHEFKEAVQWLGWIDAVEKMLPSGDAVGSVAEDGYSMDTFYDMFIHGWSTEEAAHATREDHEAFL